MRRKLLIPASVLLAVMATSGLANASSPTSINPEGLVWRGFKSCFQMMPSDRQIEVRAPNTSRHDWDNENGETCRITYNLNGFSSVVPQIDHFWPTAIGTVPGFSRVVTKGNTCCFAPMLRVQFYDRQAGWYIKGRPHKVRVNSVADAYAAFDGYRRYWHAWLIETADGPEQGFVYDAPVGKHIQYLAVPRGFVAIKKNGKRYFPGAVLLDVRYVEMVHAGTYFRANGSF